MLELLIPLLLTLSGTSLETEDQAREHIAAAQAAASPEVPVELLLAMAQTESRFDPAVVSRAKGGLFCGVLQAMAKVPGRGYSERRCKELQDLTLGYQVGADELRSWLTRTRGNMTLALRGYACGNVATGRRCKAYAGRVTRLQRRLVVLRLGGLQSS